MTAQVKLLELLPIQMLRCYLYIVIYSLLCVQSVHFPHIEITLKISFGRKRSAIVRLKSRKTKDVLVNRFSNFR